MELSGLFEDENEGMVEGEGEWLFAGVIGKADL